MFYLRVCLKVVSSLLEQQDASYLTKFYPLLFGHFLASLQWVTDNLHQMKSIKIKNPVNQLFTGFLLPFVGLFAEEEGFEPPEV